MDDTREPLLLADLLLVRVSRGPEDKPAVELVFPSRRLRLARSAVYCVLRVLGRHRPHREGWVTVNRLLQETSLTDKHLDVSIGRIRRAFLRAGLVDGNDIVLTNDGGRRLGLPADKYREDLD